MKLNKFLITCFAISCCASSFAQFRYRTQYPLPASTSITSWGVNADVNILTADEPSVQAFADGGAKLVRVDLKWANVEKSLGIYDFSYYDSLVGLFNAHGIRPILILDYGNSLYNGGNAPSTDDSRTAFINFVTAAVNRYKGIGALWEIWNEPNEDKFWKPAANANDYATLALLVAQDIRSIAPDEWIIGPALSGFDWPFIETCFQRGLLQYLDAVSVHPYRSQFIPETALPDFEALKSLIEQYRPVGHSVAIVDSEWGYSLGWVNFDADVQAKLDLRAKFVDMLEGARTSITYSWRDQGAGPSSSSVFGLHDASMAERESGTAFRVFTAALKGWKLIARLDIGSQKDFCLLFASGTKSELVAWTTVEPHPVILPSSAGSFAGIDLLGNSLQAATATAGLPAMLSDRPILLRSTSSNALLKTLTSWGRLPTSAVVGDVNRLQKVIGSTLVCPSWQYAPAGTTVTVKDVAGDQVFSLSPSVSTINNLATSTMSSAEVQQALANDCRPYDLTEGARTMRVTVTTPDGASATQSCNLYHPTPIRLTVLTPQNNALTFRAENLTGGLFQGGIKILSNGKSVDLDLSFATGELSKTFFVSSISRSDIATGLQMEVLPAMNYLPGIENFISASQQAVVNRFPDPSSGSYTAELEGDSTVPATANLVVAGAPSGAGITGMKSLKLTYSFFPGTRSIALRAPQSVANIAWPTVARSLGMWVYADGSNNALLTRFVDSTGQQFETPMATMNWIGWRFVEARLDGVGASSSEGAGDGIVHGSIQIIDPAVIVSQGQVATAGTIYIAGATVLSAH